MQQLVQEINKKKQIYKQWVYSLHVSYKIGTTQFCKIPLFYILSICYSKMLLNFLQYPIMVESGYCDHFKWRFSGWRCRKPYLKIRFCQEDKHLVLFFPSLKKHIKSCVIKSKSSNNTNSMSNDFVLQEIAQCSPLCNLYHIP